MIKKGRGCVFGSCNEVEIMRIVRKRDQYGHYYTFKNVCGRISCRTKRGNKKASNYGRCIKIEFYGSQNAMNDVRELYFHTLKFFDENKEYAIGMKRREGRKQV